ncbi:MAG: hypothetical protein JNM84_16905 [Planctomycetes bacterium]|nr:hypothetical protein [Planctomycetota bacterium]
MAGKASAGVEASGGFEPALEARLAADRRSLRREALVAVVVLGALCLVIRGLRDGGSALWPLRLELVAALMLSVAPALAVLAFARWLPKRVRRIERLDAELEARGALVAATELPREGHAPVGRLLRRAFARRLAAPLPVSALGERRARRRVRLLRWALLALLIWLWLWLARLLFGPEGPAPRGAEGVLVGPRSAQIGAGSANDAEPERSAAESPSGAPQEEPSSASEGEREEPPETPRGGAEQELPKEPERRLEDFFVRLREQGGGAAERELWVVPTSPAEDGAEPSEAGAGGTSDVESRTTRPKLAGADLLELKRAAEKATLPATLGERERVWVERYYAALRKLP